MLSDATKIKLVWLNTMARLGEKEESLKVKASDPIGLVLLHGGPVALVKTDKTDIVKFAM